MPVCNCTLHLYRFRQCRHYSSPVKHECWRADYRAKSYCLYNFFPCGKPTKVKHNRDGLCNDCADYFGQYGDLSEQVLQGFLEYKESRGWMKKRVDPRILSAEKFIPPSILASLAGNSQPFRPNSPMRPGPPNTNNDLLVPPPARQTQSTKRRAERRALAALEGVPPSDSVAGSTSDLGEYRQTGGDSDGTAGVTGATSASSYDVPRSHSISPCPLVRKITSEAERLFPNPESPLYPGVPKLTAVPQHRRRFPRAPDQEVPKSPPVVPAVIVDLPKTSAAIAGAAKTIAECRALSPPPAVPTASSSPSSGRGRFFVVASVDTGSSARRSVHARSQSLDRAVAVPPPQRLEGVYTASCPRHGAAYEFGCGECRSSLFRERGLPTEEHRERCRSSFLPPLSGPPQHPLLRHTRSVSSSSSSPPPLVISVTTPRESFTCAPQGLCTCNPAEDHVCLPCREKARFSQQIEGGWI